MSTPEPVPAVIPPEAIRLIENVPALVEGANSYICESRIQFVEGAEATRALKSIERELEKKRVSATGPLNQVLRTVNEWFRAPREKLERAESIYKAKMAAFNRAEHARIQREQREALKRAEEERLELERRATKALEKQDFAKAATLQERAEAVRPEPPPTAPIRAAGMSFSERWDYEVIDVDKIPRKYMIPNAALIGHVVRLEKGNTAIDGIRAFPVDQVSAKADI